MDCLFRFHFTRSGLSGWWADGELWIGLPQRQLDQKVDVAGIAIAATNAEDTDIPAAMHVRKVRGFGPLLMPPCVECHHGSTLIFPQRRPMRPCRTVLGVLCAGRFDHGCDFRCSLFL